MFVFEAVNLFSKPCDKIKEFLSLRREKAQSYLLYRARFTDCAFLRLVERKKVKMFLLLAKQCLPLMKNSSEMEDWFKVVTFVVAIIVLIFFLSVEKKATSWGQLNAGGCLGIVIVIAILLIGGGFMAMVFTPSC